MDQMNATQHDFLDAERRWDADQKGEIQAAGSAAFGRWKRLAALGELAGMMAIDKR